MLIWLLEELDGRVGWAPCSLPRVLVYILRFYWMYEAHSITCIWSDVHSVIAPGPIPNTVFTVNRTEANRSSSPWRRRPNSHGGPHTCVFFYSPASYLIPSSFILIHPGASLLLSSPVTFRFPLALSFSLLDPEPTEDASRCEPTKSDEVKIDASRHESTESEEAKISRGEQGRGGWNSGGRRERNTA